jgi:hypothetical protein
MAVVSIPSPTVGNLAIAPLARGGEAADAAFEGRWADWRARGLRHEIAVQRKLRIGLLIFAVLIGFLVLAVVISKGSL